ncbi:cation-dependent mannose-6-phosphate receptor [Thalassophryne amazonica]|uniref:cation-dependent mannose-6-phosphate receptor n=1 Tax=Thalassophryne amazonica TaxID=390379 RepID=UPI0014725B26|nr:cation-dependent mannose-6-phosphate receptor [Thalassophryne amazonica]
MKVLSSPGGGSFLVWTVAVQLILCGRGAHTSDDSKNCQLVAVSESEQKVLSRLEPLNGKNLTAKSQTGNDNYTYIFQLCGNAGGVQDAALVQIDKQKKTTVIGKYSASQAIGGSDWVMLIYRNGEKYDAHCSQESRKGILMISCNRKKSIGQLTVVLEERDRKEDCFYLFGLESSAVCPAVESHLSAGSIIIIIGLCLLTVYLVGGFLYQRLIVGAKGIEQFPNYSFWVEVGNLTADGCDFVCRSRNREEAPAYRGVSTEPLEVETDERDDHLLPM